MNRSHKSAPVRYIFENTFVKFTNSSAFVFKTLHKIWASGISFRSLGFGLWANVHRLGPSPKKPICHALNLEASKTKYHRD